MKDIIRSKLANKIVGIAGAGGLGSNCAVALARIGVGKIIIADFDVIDESNLNRQYFFRDQIGLPKVDALNENIKRIDEQIIIEAHNIKLNSENIPTLFELCDVIVEAFDLAEMKKMIIETVLEKMPDKYIVAGSGLAGWGNNNSLTTKKYDKLFMCGDNTMEVSDDLPPLAPRVGIVANMQANQVLEILLSDKFNGK